MAVTLSSKVKLEFSLSPVVPSIAPTTVLIFTSLTSLLHLAHYAPPVSLELHPAIA